MPTEKTITLPIQPTEPHAPAPDDTRRRDAPPVPQRTPAPPRPHDHRGRAPAGRRFHNSRHRG